MEKLAVDMTLTEGASAISEMQTLAAGIAQLYRKASEKWPGRPVSQHCLVKDGVFTVELASWDPSL